MRRRSASSSTHRAPGRSNLDGGATEEHFDMRGGHLVRLDLAAGTTRATVILPARPGTQIVPEVGGASVLTVATPASVLARVQVGGRAGSVQIGAISHSGMPAGRTLADVDYQQSQQRLDGQLVGGCHGSRFVSPGSLRNRRR